MEPEQGGGVEMAQNEANDDLSWLRSSPPGCDEINDADGVGASRKEVTRDEVGRETDDSDVLCAEDVGKEVTLGEVEVGDCSLQRKLVSVVHDETIELEEADFGVCGESNEEDV
jgi:hypothetical protein